MTAGPLQPYSNCPQSHNCHEDGGPTINKAITVTRQVGRRHPTTNQTNIKMFELMMKMVIIIPIIIIIGMSIPNTQSRPKDARGNHHKKTRTHTMPQRGRVGTTTSRPTPGPHHTTGRGEGSHHHTTPHHTTPHHREAAGESLGGGGMGGGGRPKRES